jgi:hypothetical protein
LITSYYSLEERKNTFVGFRFRVFRVRISYKVTDKVKVIVFRVVRLGLGLSGLRLGLLGLELGLRLGLLGLELGLGSRLWIRLWVGLVSVYGWVRLE